jgi:hypothetical protein
MPTNAIVTWFNPGRNSGHEFVYSRSEDQELARAKQQTISAMEPSKHQFVVVEPRPNATQCTRSPSSSYWR